MDFFEELKMDSVTEILLQMVELKKVREKINVHFS